MAFKESVNQLKSWSKYRKRESEETNKRVKKHKRKEKEKKEYYTFKKAIVQEIDKLMYSGEYETVEFRIKEGYDHLFYYLSEDDDFVKFYDVRFTAGGEFAVSQRSLD